MASVFVYHVVGDLTVGKPELVEFLENETVEAAIKAIGEAAEGGIPVWKRKPLVGTFENSEMRQQRFVGILDSLDIVAFLARSECLQDQEKALKTPVSEVVLPNNSLLKLVDPGTRLIDALEMMKHGVKRLLVPKSIVWKGMSKRFSMIYRLKNVDSFNNSSSKNLLTNNLGLSSSSSSSLSSSSSTTGTSIRDKFCCLSREDVFRFIIGCLGALAPLPLTSISTLGIINPNYFFIEASLPAMEATQKRPEEPRAVAVVEDAAGDERQCKIVGEISAAKLWKCDHGAAAWALANLSAGQFVMGVEDNSTPRLFHDSQVNSKLEVEASNEVGLSRTKAIRNRSISFGFLSNQRNPSMSSMYRGRSAPLTCKPTSTLAAVMTQMLSHRATHVWVIDDETEYEEDDVLVGLVGYADILVALTKHPSDIPQPKS